MSSRLFVMSKPYYVSASFSDRSKPIRSWPIALSGRDIISVARTGSGKTLGFLLPAFHALLNRPGGCKPKMGAPYIVVLAPTRELACQINEEATKFGKPAGIRSTTVYGEPLFC